MVLREGQTVGPFRVLELVGSGGMGEVWRARDERLSRGVALKVLHRGARVEDLRTRLLAEAFALSALHHPHIVVVRDVLSLDDSGVLVMEHATDDALSARLKGRAMPRLAALELASAIADALAAAHGAGVVHRDVKPANVLLTASGTPKVIDFGLARQRAAVAPDDATIGPVGSSSEGLFSGTPAYISPEHGWRPVDHPSGAYRPPGVRLSCSRRRSVSPGGLSRDRISTNFDSGTVGLRAS